MQPPQKPPPARGAGIYSCLSIGGALVLLCFAAAAIGFLTLGATGIAIPVVGVLFAVVAFHYLVWGRWLSQSIRDEVEAEDRLAEARQRAAGAGSKPGTE